MTRSGFLGAYSIANFGDQLVGYATRHAAHIVHTLAEMWFGERTLQFTAQLLREHGVPDVAIKDWLRDFDRFRVKAHDLIAFLTPRPFDATERSAATIG